ncbi:TraB/GumN family protein [Gluconobacter cerinus]|uniref:TraB/GumN family protein n=1 Tax=Gluconobacter TaxID=441 RepID=UPI001B8D1FDD|nr:MULTISPECIES: TraB/GumN family protein [Gluconobacter]MBS1041961.1 TraB/GumN family protein [Gluconobacter cerinus]MBS1048549.1 TraB/GumN family protein [Gluconobacter cerinus]MBS1063929.1 TraB/GumN family protein [Gluconobacter wancherniae]
MTDKHTTIRKICVLITLGAIMVLRCSVALAGVEAIQIEKSGIKPSIIVPGVHAPVFGIEAPSAAVFVGKSVLLSEGTEANQDAKTQPEKLEHSVPEIVLNPTVVASWVNGIDIEKLKPRLQLHLACYTGQEMLRARNTDMYSRVLLNMKTAQAAEFILEMPCPQPAGLSRDDLVRTEAQESGVTIKRLEHLNEWEAVQKEIPDDYYRDSIVEMLKRPEENLSSPPFVSFVQNGQYDEFDAWIRNRNVTVSQKKMYEYDVTKRTSQMYRAMTPYVRSGGAVILIGAAHLGGPDGLAALLRRDGYYLRPITLPEHK